MGKFIIKNTKNKQLMFVLKSENGEVILTSQMYTTKNNCKVGIASVKMNALFDNMYIKEEGDMESHESCYWYFNMIAKNGEVIGTSEMYDSAQCRDHGIESVKENAVDAPIKDKTGWFMSFFS